MKYEEAKRLLIADLRQVSNSKAEIYYGNKNFTFTELADEIENETEIGKEHILLYIETINKINKIRIKINLLKKKYWWQFWK